MDLQDFLDGLSAEGVRETQRHDLKFIIDEAKKKGLILTKLEARAVKTAAGGLGRKAIPIDKSAGELVADLAGVKTMWMDVTPAMAELWLNNNFNNRKVSLDTVRGYAREMVNKKWLPTHQGLAFNSRDELIDGQHRLMAVVMSGETVRMLVTFGLPSKVAGTRMTAMDTVDRGKTRTVADQLKIQHGISNGSQISLICSRLAAICSPEKTRRLSVGEILDIHEMFEEGIDWVFARRSKLHGLKQAGLLAAFAFALSVEGIESETAEMFQQVVQGTTKEGSAGAALHAFLTQERAILLTRGNDRGLAELVLQAIWLEKQGQEVTELSQGLEGIAYYRTAQAEKVSRVAGMFELPKMKNGEVVNG